MGPRKSEETGANTNSWMTTYTDLMTLLLTFFVLLLSLSVIDKERKKLAINSLVGAFGFKPGAHSVIGKQKGLNITVGTAPMRKEDVSFERLRNIALKNGVENDLIMIKERERIVITVNNRIFFKSHSASIEPGSTAFLNELAEIVKDDTCAIEFRGYCAPSEVIFEKDAFRRSMLLSSERAMAVFEYFRDKRQIPAKRMVAHGFGKNFRGEGTKPKKARFNRQVEIILDYGEKIPFRLKKPKKRDSLLDFRGFLFKMPGDAHE